VISLSQRPLPNITQHSQQINIHAPVGFDPTISASERPQTYVLDCAATGIGATIDLRSWKLCQFVLKIIKFVLT